MVFVLTSSNFGRSYPLTTITTYILNDTVLPGGRKYRASGIGAFFPRPDHETGIGAFLSESKVEPLAAGDRLECRKTELSGIM